FVDAEDIRDDAGGLAGAAEPVLVLVADGPVGEGVGGGAADVAGEGLGGVGGDGLVVGDVEAAAAGCGFGEHPQGRGLAAAGAGREDEVVGGGERVDRVLLFEGRKVHRAVLSDR